MNAPHSDICAAIWNFNCFGVIDNNNFDNLRYPTRIAWGSGTGQNNYANLPDIVFGTADDNMYLEDNDFTGIDLAVSDGDQGGRYAFRYNNITETQAFPLFDVHGGRGSLWGGMGGEIYGNLVTGPAGYVVSQRGGRMTVHHNQMASGSTVNLYNNDGCPPDPYGSRQKINGSYHFLNRASATGSLLPDSSSGGDNCGGVVVENTTYWMDATSFDGTVGIGYGPLANRPSTCTTGVGYWATNQSTTDLTGMVGKNPSTPISGTFYYASATNTWSPLFTPLTYPHPLRGEGVSASPVSMFNIIKAINVKKIFFSLIAGLLGVYN